MQPDKRVTMSAQKPCRSWPKPLLIIGLLASAILFDGGSGTIKSVFENIGLYPAIQAASSDHTTPRLLMEVVPGADSFSDKEGEVPVYKAYRTDPNSGEQTLIGYAFVSADTLPEPSGFSGPIDSLIGIDLEGTIVGFTVVYYKESHRFTLGDFLSWPGVQEQYVGKRAADRFQVGNDIDGLSKATITVKAMAAGVRRSMRAVTTAYIR